MSENYQAENLEFDDASETMSDETMSAIDDDWYSDGFADAPEPVEETEPEANSEPAEADQQAAEETVDNQAEEAPAEAAEQAEENTEAVAEAADQRLTVKHLDSVRELDWHKDKDEIQTLVQKGMDYDRKTEKLNSKIAAYEEFLDEMSGSSGLDRVQLMDSIRARMLVAKESNAGRQMSEADALLKVQAERENKAKQAAESAAAEQQRQKADTEKRVSNALARFANARPDVKAADIPQSVWDDFRNSGDMEASYAKYENSQYKAKIASLEQEIEAIKKNAQNAAHSTGSRKTSGNLSAEAAFDKLWYDGT